MSIALLYILSIDMILGGMIAASSFVLEQIPSASKFIDTVKPYAMILGVISLALGFIALFLGLGQNAMTDHPTGTAIVAMCIGAVLARDLLKQFKMSEKQLTKWTNLLAGSQIIVGIIAIAVGVVRMILSAGSFLEKIL